MKIVRQIDETHFEVEMEPSDKTREIEVFVEHDYLSISAQLPFLTGIDVYGEYNGGPRNVLKNYCTVQIPIREAQKIIELLKNNRYLQTDHLLTKNGKPNYLWNNKPIKFLDNDGEWKVAVRDDKECVYSIIPMSIYNKIKEGE